MSTPIYLVGINPSAVPGGPLQQTLVLTSEITGGGGTTVSVNAVSVANPNFNNSTPAAPVGHTNVIWQVSGSDVSAYYATSGTTVPFSMVTTGDNTSAAMTVDTGA